MSDIKTTGDLRSFLAKTLKDVADGTIEITKAAAITKLAGQINESFYTETKVAIVRQKSNEIVASLGKLPID